MSSCSFNDTYNSISPPDNQSYLPLPGWPYPAPRDVCPGCGRCGVCGRGGGWFGRPWWGIYTTSNAPAICGAF